MKYGWKTILIATLAATMAGGLVAKPKVIDRQSEKEEFPDLQVTEKKQEQNIINVMERLNSFGPLAEMGQEDRMQMFKSLENPTDFRYTLKNIYYTPRNTYIRYVKEAPEVITVGFGAMDELTGLINEKVQQAKTAGVKASEIQFGTREGIELTQFEFIHASIGHDPNVVVGSQRKSVTLYYKPVNSQADTERQMALDMVVTRVVEDNQRDSVKNVELIIDPTPLDDNMDDIIIMHRLNKKVPTVTVLGAMSNTPSYPLRTEFKQKFYVKLLDHFYRLYRLVDNFAHKDTGKYQEDVVNDLIDQLYY